ncbi:MAG: hypothetical protein ACHRXM_07370 [Isosphaerales bacterium]
MNKPFDATARELIELGPAAWLEYLGIPVPDSSRVRVIDSNLSTITAEADKVLLVEDPKPWIQHVELQAGRDTRLNERAQRYNTLLGYRFRIPVRTSLILLRPEADGPELTGELEKHLPWGERNSWFGYNVVRVWKQPVKDLLAAGLPILPLAPVSDVELEQVPGVLLTISRRFVNDTTPDQTALLWAATKVLMGLRYPAEKVDEFTEEVSAMILGIRGIEESSVYQAIFAKGRAEGEVIGREEGVALGATQEARKNLLLLGRQKLGQPDERVLAQIADLTDLDRLDSLLGRILDVSSWDELLAPPKT